MFSRRKVFRSSSESSKVQATRYKKRLSTVPILPTLLPILPVASSRVSFKNYDFGANFSTGISTLPNSRTTSPEDRVVAHLSLNNSGVSLFGVVDGHGGGACANYVSEALPRVIEKAYTNMEGGGANSLLNESWGSILEESFQQVAHEWDHAGVPASGCVATLVLVSNRSCLIAHAGDCKVIASLPDDSYVELTRDHRCSDPEEAERVELAGGVVFNGRLEGKLMPSRAFGDINVRMRENGDLIDCIAPEPDLCYHQVEDDRDEFIIIASDGLFDVVPAARAASYVRRSLIEHGSAGKAAAGLVQMAAKRTTDDISVIVLSFSRTS